MEVHIVYLGNVELDYNCYGHSWDIRALSINTFDPHLLQHLWEDANLPNK